MRIDTPGQHGVLTHSIGVPGYDIRKDGDELDPEDKARLLRRALHPRIDFKNKTVRKRRGRFANGELDGGA